MPLTPIVGSVRLRQLQLGLESTFKTTVAATRRLPWQMTAWNPNPQTWTFPVADTGTLSQAIAPYGLGNNMTGTFGGPLASNDAPTVISAGVMGGLSLVGGGAAKTLTASPADTSQDVFDTYTMEWGDDSTDVFQMGGCVIDHFTLTYPQDQGPIALSADWALSSATYQATFTGSLNVDTSPVYLYCADTEFYVNDTSGAIETTKLSNIAYGAMFEVVNNLDRKRFANGSNTRMQIANYGRGERVVNFTLTGAKQSAWISEAAKWIGANATERFWGIKTTSTVDAQSGTKHSLDIRFPGYWMTRTEQTIGSNTAFDLIGHNIFDSGLGYPFRMVSVSTRTAL